MAGFHTLNQILDRRHRRLRRRATRLMLAGLPDHVQRDIGVTRSGAPFDSRRWPEQ
ncbi:DUF1127 domain-containing protein [Roseobacter sp. A03A-229]